MTATVFKNARLVLPGEVVQGSLQVDSGRIASMDGGATSALRVAAALVTVALVASLIDLRGRRHRETV